MLSILKKHRVGASAIARSGRVHGGGIVHVSSIPQGERKHVQRGKTQGASHPGQYQGWTPGAEGSEIYEKETGGEKF